MTERLILTRNTCVRRSEPGGSRPEAFPLSQAAGIILSAGFGTRMLDITHGRIAKHTLQLKPALLILDNPLGIMRRAGIRNIYIATQSSTHDSLRRVVKGNDEYDGIYYVPLGTYSPQPTIDSLQTVVREHEIQTVVIKMDGDEALLDFDLQEMYESHIRNQQPVTCLLSTFTDGSEKYRVWLDYDERIKAVREAVGVSADGGYALTGVWIINPSQFGLLNESKTPGEFMRKCIAAGLLYGYVYQGRFFNINTPQDLISARRALK